MTYAIATQFHTAHLEPLLGVGLLRLPPAEQDVIDPTAETAYVTIHGIDRARVLAALEREGYEPLEDDDGLWCVWQEGRDGAQWVTLLGPSIQSEVEPLELEAGWQALAEEVIKP